MGADMASFTTVSIRRVSGGFIAWKGRSPQVGNEWHRYHVFETPTALARWVQEWANEKPTNNETSSGDSEA